MSRLNRATRSQIFINIEAMSDFLKLTHEENGFKFYITSTE